MLPRILEPEVMDTVEDAHEYDEMDHSLVNRLFVDHLLEFVAEVQGPVLDVGTGTARIPIELCRRASGFEVLALDAAEEMLKLAQHNILEAGLQDRILATLVDAKVLPFDDGHFAMVVSNSIIHHIPVPLSVFAEMVRVTAPGGVLFVRDLLRPADQATLDQLVQTYAADANEYQQQLFRDSLHAALTLDEVQDLIQPLGFPRDSVRVTSDRHWTWAARKV